MSVNSSNQEPSPMPIRILHLHIPKTAGSAIRTAFAKADNRRLRIFPHYLEDRFANVNPTDYDVYSGHFGYKTASSIGGSMITVLRNPTDRFISSYFFWKQLYETGKERSKRTILAMKYPLDQFVQIRDDPSLIPTLVNTATWQIAHGSSIGDRRECRDRGMSEDDVLRLAVKNLHGFLVVGIQENLIAFCQRLQAQLSLSLNVVATNVTQNRPYANDLNLPLRTKIFDWTYMDHELYQHVMNKCLKDNGGDRL